MTTSYTDDKDIIQNNREFQLCESHYQLKPDSEQICLKNTILGTKNERKVEKIFKITKAVSYTHLDVYKRQALHWLFNYHNYELKECFSIL